MSTDKDLAYWLVLWRQPYIGPQRIQKLLAISEDLSIFFKEGKLTQQAAYHLDPRSLKIELDWKGVKTDLAWLEASSQHHIITINSALYPTRLKEIPQAPSLLFVKGDPTILGLPQIGMVGSRHPTSVGFEDAFSFAKSLTQKRMVVTSGLAMGIDTASHKGALAQGGKTIAVLGHGLDQIYPKCNTVLAQNIIRLGGALVSEFPIGTAIKPEFFPKRNRIISGLSIGIFVVEAALKSGSLITANYALEQGREVFAMPGSIHNPLAKGCNSLIRQGAKCVETADHLIEELQHMLECEVTVLEESHTIGVRLLSAIDYVCTSIESIIDRTGLTLEKFRSVLLQMELEGTIVAVPGGYVRHTIGVLDERNSH